MAPIARDPSTVIPRQDSARGFGHGHTSDVGHGHSIIADSLRAQAAPEPIRERVTVVTHVDEHAEPVVALGLRVHDEKKPLGPSIVPPTKGQRLPYRNLPSTAEQRAAMLKARLAFQEQRYERTMYGRY